MRNQLVVAFMLGLVGTATAQPAKRSNTPSAAQSVPDPVKDFEKIVKRCQAAVESENTPAISVYYNSRISSWVRQVREFEVRFDVRKTDSLVAPIVGQINILRIGATEKAADEQSAEALNFTIASSPSHMRNRYEASFVWRDQKWRFKEGVSMLDFFRDGGYGNTMESNIDASKGVSYYGPIGVCFPE